MNLSLGFGLDKYRVQDATLLNQNEPELPDGIVVTTVSGKYITTVGGKYILTVNGFIPYAALRTLSGKPIVTESGKYITK